MNKLKNKENHSNNNRMYTFIIAFFLCCCFLQSCTQIRLPCLIPRIASFNLEMIHFPSDTSTIPIDTALPHAVFSPIIGRVYDTSFIYSQQSSFTISLSMVSDSCKWAFTTDTTSGIVHLTDTFCFYYQRKLQFLSNACGYTNFYNLDSVHTTHNNIDSVFINNTNITNDIKPTHLKIYIHHDY